MTDRLAVTLCGADRQPLPDRFDLDVSVWQSRRPIKRVRDGLGTVEVNDVSPTTTYRIEAYPLRHRPVHAHVIGGRSVELYCPVHPGRVSSVEWPAKYPDDLTRAISREALDQLGDIARAGLLNVYAKMVEADLWPHVIRVTSCAGDRILAAVHPSIAAALECSPQFQDADDSLHSPPLGFDRAGSFKERGVPYGGLQVTLFTDGEVTEADIDVDDAGGLGHVFQVLDHWLSRGETHPYDIHQILTFHQGVDPGYRLVV
jgi:hypothetical protein